jgi:hypothetical protein
MTKKNKTAVDDLIQNIDLSVSQGSQTFFTNSLKGKTISLNQKIQPVFGVGPIWLSSSNYSTVIPDTITYQEEEIIKKALSSGSIVEGNTYISPIDKNKDVLSEYWHLIKTFGLEPNNSKSESVIKFRKLLKEGVDRNWTAKEISSFCIEQEKKYKNRERVIKLLNDVYKNSDCPATLLEEPTS